MPLPFALRQGGEAQARLESGEEVALKLKRGEVLRGGDLVTASDGRVIEVVAILEKLLQVTGSSLAKLAYHLGSRHVPVEVGEDYLRVARRSGRRKCWRTGVNESSAPFTVNDRWRRRSFEPKKGQTLFFTRPATWAPFLHRDRRKTRHRPAHDLFFACRWNV